VTEKINGAERPDPGKILKKHPPLAVTEAIIKAIPSPYPSEHAIHACSGALVELICRRYPDLTQQIVFTRKLFEGLELMLKRRSFVGERMQQIADQLRKEGKTVSNSAVLSILQQEMQEAVAAPLVKQ
jgi:hypothetical protein